MKLLTYEDYEVKIAPEALSLSVFRDIWERDKNKDKRMARMEISYIYLMEDPRSDYLAITDLKQRSSEIIKDEGLPKGWKPDEKIRAAQDFYKEKLPVQAKWLASEQVYINKLEELMLNINPGATNKEGRFINPLNQSTQLIETYNKAIKQYTETEKTIFADLQHEEKIRGTQEKGMFENLDDV